MTHITEVQPKLEVFKKWLVDRGAQIHGTTNEYELIRFKTDKGMSVVYTKKSGVITFFGESEKAWNAFRTAGSWRAMPATKRKQNNQIATIRKRDGDLCFYCQEHVSDKEASEEHLVSLTHGGPDHISNKFLAHGVCNNNVGNLSAVEKIKIHTAAVIRVAAQRLKEMYVPK